MHSLSFLEDNQFSKIVEKFDAGFDMPDNGQTDTAGPASQAIIDAQQQGMNDINSLSRKLPSGSDFLIAYATVPGNVLISL